MRGGPEEAQADAGRATALKGKQKSADTAYSRVNTAKAPLGDRPKGGCMVRFFERRTQSHRVRSLIVISDCLSDTCFDECVSKRPSHPMHGEKVNYQGL